jgi:hypothetical protein
LESDALARFVCASKELERGKECDLSIGMADNKSSGVKKSDLARCGPGKNIGIARPVCGANLSAVVILASIMLTGRDEPADVGVGGSSDEAEERREGTSTTCRTPSDGVDWILLAEVEMSSAELLTVSKVSLVLTCVLEGFLSATSQKGESRACSAIGDCVC